MICLVIYIDQGYFVIFIIMGGLVKQNLVSHSDMLVSDHRRRGKEKN